MATGPKFDSRCWLELEASTNGPSLFPGSARARCHCDDSRHERGRGCTTRIAPLIECHPNQTLLTLNMRGCSAEPLLRLFPNRLEHDVKHRYQEHTDRNSDDHA